MKRRTFAAVGAGLLLTTTATTTTTSAAQPALAVSQRLPATGAVAPAAEAGSRAIEAAERQRLLTEGEAELAAGDVDAAESLLDRAALLRHAGDTEIALVRTYLQAGRYRQALAFAAHAAGAHPDEPATTALYAWLLHLSGHGSVATRLLDGALSAGPDDGDLRRVRALIAGVPPPAGHDMPAGAPALRLAPYAIPPPPQVPADAAAQPAAGQRPASEEIPAGARVAGSGIRVGDGSRAVVPAPLLRGAGRLWLRNGLGQTVSAWREQRSVADAAAADAGIAVLLLGSALAPCGGLTASPAEPFAGSPAAMVGYRASTMPEAAWPQLTAGFFGRRTAAAQAPRPLGIDAPPGGPLGGPVFDAAGRLAGIAVAGADGARSLIGVATLTSVLGRSPAAEATAGRLTPVDVDSVYECALRVALQLIVSDD